MVLILFSDRRSVSDSCVQTTIAAPERGHNSDVQLSCPCWSFYRAGQSQGGFYTTRGRHWLTHLQSKCSRREREKKKKSGIQVWFECRRLGFCFPGCDLCRHCLHCILLACVCMFFQDLLPSFFNRMIMFLQDSRYSSSCMIKVLQDIRVQQLMCDKGTSGY